MSPQPKLQGPRQSVEALHPSSKRLDGSMEVYHLHYKGNGEAWDSITRTQGSIQKRETPKAQLKKPHCNKAHHHPNLRSHAKTCETMAWIPQGTPKHRDSFPQTRRATPPWEYITPNQGGTPKSGSASSTFGGEDLTTGVHHADFRGHTDAWESTTPRYGAAPEDWSP